MSALPALSKGVRLTVPHELHPMPPIFQPGKQGNIATAKSGNLQQTRGRKVPNLHNNRQKYKGNMVLPPLEMASNENPTNKESVAANNENINNDNQIDKDQKNPQVSIQESEPKRNEGQDNSYLDTRYSDEGEFPSENASEEEVPLNEDPNKSEEIDADPSEFGVTVCKL